jgi:GT2 family glycosyltransferase
VKQAQGKYIAFTDDDCRLAPDYLNRMLAHFENDGRPAIRGGMVKLGDPTDLPTAIKERPEQLVLTYPMHPGTVALGCNMAMSREVFAQIGLFDERFGAGTLLRSAEETEFFYRAFQHSIPVIYVPDMIVFHFHGRKTLESMRKQIVSYAIGTGGMAAKHAFSSTLLSRHVYWDARAFVRDLRSGGRSSRWREASEFTWLTGVLRGIGLFWLSSLIRRSNAKGREA